MSRFAILLMSLGMGLLAVFLGLFLQKTWADEAETLKREAGLLFVNTVQGVQQEVFDQLIVRRIDEKGPGLPDIHFSGALARPVQEEFMDSVRVITFVQTEKFDKRSNDSSSRTDREKFRIALQESNTPGATDMSGALSVIVNLKSGNGQDSICIRPDSLLSLGLLRGKFEQAMQARFPTIGVSVSRPGDMSGKQGFVCGSYSDLVSGERYEASLSGVEYYLLKKVGVSALFALLLFCCMGAAFALIYRSLKQQQRLTELKNDFIRNITPELKTPIATVGVAVEALQRFDALENPERTREYLDISQHELKRLSLLVDKVLRMSLFEKGAPELKPEALDIKDLVQGILSSMKLQFEQRRAQVEFEVSDQAFPLEADRLHLASVVYNLLDNALKYSREVPQIKVSLQQNEHEVQLAVSDRGRGIPAAYTTRIFETFFRVPTGDVHNVKGHGLGLSYVSGVVQRHKGSIAVESQEGEGSTFTITLPKRA